MPVLISNEFCLIYYMKKIKAILCISASVIVLCAAVQCKKTTPVRVVEALPAETMTGARTFGCLVDGVIWIPKGNSLLPAISTTIQFNILNLNTTKENQGIVFSIDPLTSEGNYNLMVGNNRAEYSIDAQTYRCTAGTMEVTRYDKVNKVLSGRFSFTGKDINTGKTVSITNGRFDVPFTN